MKIACFGSSLLDTLVIRVEQRSVWSAEESIPARGGIHRRPGGMALNIISQLHHLDEGSKNTFSLITKFSLGNKYVSEHIKSLKRVNLFNLLPDGESAVGECVCVSEDLGDHEIDADPKDVEGSATDCRRFFLTNVSSNLHFSPDDLCNVAPAIKECGIVHFANLGGEDAYLSRRFTDLLWSIKEYRHSERVAWPILSASTVGIRHALSTRHEHENIRRFTKCLDWLVCNQEEAQLLLERDVYVEEDIASAADSCRTISEKYQVPGVVITCGPRGAAVFSGSVGLISVPGVPCRQVCDPTGAGDAWVASFLHSLSKNMSIERAAKLANHFASASLTKIGGSSRIMSESELLGTM